MGVQGLWSILYSTGRDIDISSLEGKVLAIDLSIWLHQALKSGIDSPNAHLEILFRRICKLLYFNIKPIFVFDGPFPSLKKENIATRRKQRQMKLDKSSQIKSNIMNLLLKKHMIENGKLKSKKVNKINEADEIFKLPENGYFDLLSQRNFEIDLGFTDLAQDYLTNFRSGNEINLESDSFNSMPLEVQHEVIRNVAKEKRYGYTTDKDNLSEKTGEDFSSIQIQRLLNRNTLQQKVENLRTCMNYRNNQNVINSLKCHQMKSLLPNNVNTRKIMSHNDGYLMMIDPSESDLVDSLTKLKRKYIFRKSEKHQDVDEIVFKEEPLPLPSSDIKKSNDQSQMTNQSKSRRNSENSLHINSDDKDLSEYLQFIEKPFIEYTSEVSLIQDKTEKELPKSKMPEFEGNTEKPLCDHCDIENIVEKSSFSELNSSYDILGLKEKGDCANEFVDECCVVKENYQKQQSPEPTDIPINSSSEKWNISEVSDINSTTQINLENKNVSASPEHSDDSNSDDADFVDVPEIVEKDSDNANISEFSPDEIEMILTNPIKWQQNIEEEISQLYEEERIIENQAISMSERYYQEAKELLKLFGIPYVESPGEAEAQCAFLEKAKFTEGTITEDSDIWLFGGSMVYKHFFSRDCSVRAYDRNFIFKKLGLTKDLMICIALLSGSDYTPGIYGIGPVIAMEILAEFSDPKIKQSHFEVLKNFKNFSDIYSDDNNQLCPVSPNKKRFLKFKLNSDFPDQRIIDAYNIPLVDESNEPFIWNKPFIEKLLEFAKLKIGWSNLKVLEMLNLVLDSKRTRPKMYQKSILQYFTNSEVDELLNSKKSPSKRLKLAVKRRDFILKDVKRNK